MDDRREPKLLIRAAFAMGAGASLALILALIATPFGQRAVVRGLERRIQPTQGAPLAASPTLELAAGRLCAGPMLTAIEDARGGLTRAASGTGVTLSSLTLSPVQPDAHHGVSEATASLRARASEARLERYIRAVGEGTPSLFVDHLTLTATGVSDEVQLDLSGRLICTHG